MVSLGHDTVLKINKLIIIRILRNQTKMIIGILKIGCTQSGNRLYNIMCNFFCCFPRKYFFIFI